MIRPTADRVLIERLDGDGREETSPGGIIMPARDLSVRRGNTWRVPDTFRARVLAVGPKAEHELSVGDEVVVQTYEGDGGAKSVGLETEHGLIVELEDILVVFEREPATAEQRAAMLAILKSPAAKEALGCGSFPESAYTSAPLLGLVPKEPQSVKDLGFHRKGGF